MSTKKEKKSQDYALIRYIDGKNNNIYNHLKQSINFLYRSLKTRKFSNSSRRTVCFIAE